MNNKMKFLKNYIAYFLTLVIFMTSCAGPSTTPVQINADVAFENNSFNAKSSSGVVQAGFAVINSTGLNLGSTNFSGETISRSGNPVNTVRAPWTNNTG